MRSSIRFSRNLIVFLLIIPFTLMGCTAAPTTLTVTLETPANGSSVPTLTPTLAWNCTEAATSYRIQVAEDSNFQTLTIDQANLAGATYNIPSGKLTNDRFYYWRVSAEKDGQTSGWSVYWSLKTPLGEPTTGTITATVTLDGSAWSGQVSYTVTGPNTETGSSAPQSFSNLLAGNYTIGYSSGGPVGATLSNITPSSTQALSPGSTTTFTLNFSTPSTDTIVVNAVVDGSAWSGPVNYMINGPQTNSGSAVTQSFSNLPAGTYTVSYSSGGPPGATLSNITPYPTQSLSSGSTATFTLNFHTQTISTISVSATIDGVPWSGVVRYTITGPRVDSHSSVPASFGNLPAGTYTLTCRSGGPAGASLASITPSPTQSLPAGGTITFALNFHSVITSALTVNATVNGVPWSGAVTCTIYGPYADSNSYVPYTFSNLPAGNYTVSYSSGGPPGATLVSITPLPTQFVAAGSNVTFTLNFHSQLTSAISINATLDGSPWSGVVYYTISGPMVNPGSTVPQTFGNLPAGTYTITYNSGGPASATLGSITPAPTQSLPAGGTLTFLLNFHSQPSGTIMVNALLDGAPWVTAIGSGPINYTLSGPQSDSGSSIPQSFSNLPAGSYTLSYNSGGPIGATLVSITPAAMQSLASGGNITFTLNFQAQPRGTVVVNATLNGSPWEGAVTYNVAGPYMDASASVPETLSNCPAGSYTISYTSGGPLSSVLDNISPSPTQTLSPAGTITFTLNFVGGLLQGED